MKKILLISLFTLLSCNTNVVAKAEDSSTLYMITYQKNYEIIEWSPYYINNIEVGKISTNIISQFLYIQTLVTEYSNEIPLDWSESLYEEPNWELYWKENILTKIALLNYTIDNIEYNIQIKYDVYALNLR